MDLTCTPLRTQPNTADRFIVVAGDAHGPRQDRFCAGFERKSLHAPNAARIFDVRVRGIWTGRPNTMTRKAPWLQNDGADLTTLQHWEDILETAAGTYAERKLRKKVRVQSITPREQHVKAAATTTAGKTSKAGRTSAGSSSGEFQASDAWQEAVEAAEAENASLRSQLDQLRQEHAAALDKLSKMEKTLETTKATSEAYAEAAHEAGDAGKRELTAALQQQEARAEAKTRLLSSTADMALRDVASLRAQKVLQDVHATTLSREMCLLDGTVGFLAERLRGVQSELTASLHAQAAHSDAAEAPARYAVTVVRRTTAHPKAERTLYAAK